MSLSLRLRLRLSLSPSHDSGAVLSLILLSLSHCVQLHTPDAITTSSQGSRLIPASILALFDGGPFDADYNRQYRPIKFEVPRHAEKVLLEAVITGMLHAL